MLASGGLPESKEGLGAFFGSFYNTDRFAPDRISSQALAASFQAAVDASPFASYACVDTWLTDFRGPACAVLGCWL